MTDQPPSKFWVILLLKIGIAVIVHLVENIRDPKFLAKAQDEVSGVNGRIRKQREILQTEIKDLSVR